MNKLVSFSFVLLAYIWAVSGQGETSAMFNISKIDITSLPIGPVCTTKIQNNVGSCNQDVSIKWTTGIMKNETDKALLNKDYGKIKQLKQKATCCSACDLMDCVEAIVKQCSSTDQDNMKDIFTDPTDYLGNRKNCSNFKYHSTECMVTSETNVDPDTKVNPTNAPIGQDCLAKIQSGNASCSEAVKNKWTNQVREEAQKALINGETNKIQDLPNKIICCSSYEVIDCLGEVVKQCNSNDRDNMKMAYEKAKNNMEQLSTCSNFKYHSSECSATPDKKVNPDKKVDPGTGFDPLKIPVGPDCYNKIFNSGEGCAEDLVKNYQQYTSNNDNQYCCFMWQSRDCAKQIVKQCSLTDQDNLEKYIQVATNFLEQTRCSNNMYQKTDCSGSAIISASFVQLALFVLAIIYLTSVTT